MVEKKTFCASFTRHFCRLHIGRVPVLSSNRFITLAIGGLMDQDICIDPKTDAGIGLTRIAQNSDDFTRSRG